ncbi:MAG: acyl-CoA reductase [Cyclobacteriaceae bacterium]|nr:MAG: acyl-CoA reductase [Cyclobacteriaceae bacterium]
MLINKRVEILAHWGEIIRSKDWSQLYQSILKSNPWFTKESVNLALSGLNRYLELENLTRWSSAYRLAGRGPKVVGMVMAGNIPLVGIHDLLCCYLSGHHAVVKTSSQDNILVHELWKELAKLDPQVEQQIRFVSKILPKKIDAIIVTGSDNTSRYFKYQFQGIPCIFRSNRTSVAVISGNESNKELESLGQDIYSYFGRGCRNVSKLMVPEGYHFDLLISSQDKYRYLLKTSKYFDNYCYQKALNTVRGDDFLDTGFSLFLENPTLTSPLSVIHYQPYQKLEKLTSLLSENHQKIQCVASAGGWFKPSYLFGSLQQPDLWDYADNLDTMEFLLGL